MGKNFKHETALAASDLNLREFLLCMNKAACCCIIDFTKSNIELNSDIIVHSTETIWGHERQLLVANKSSQMCHRWKRIKSLLLLITTKNEICARVFNKRGAHYTYSKSN